jgi:hypothetical protein
MATISSDSRIAYIYKESTDTWHPVAGAASPSAEYDWSGNHSFAATVTFYDVVSATAGINNFQNPAARDAALPDPEDGVVCFVRQDSSGSIINQVQYYSGSTWRYVNDSATLISKTANYTLLLSDAGKTIDVSSSSNVVVTVPANDSVQFQTGQKIEILRSGTGTVSIAGDTGVTINSKNGNLKIAAQYSAAVLVKRDTNTWTLIGDLTA